jgi:hypothetical protein
MTEKIILPEGVTFNENNSNEIELELIEEIINDTICNKCNLHLQAVLVTNGSRHNGYIKTVAQDKKNIWENSLPKDRIRSIKMLNDTLSIKLEKHQERHSND